MYTDDVFDIDLFDDDLEESSHTPRMSASQTAQKRGEKRSELI